MLTDSFAFYVSVLRRHFTAYCTEKLADMGITYGQLYILIYVGKKRKCSPKEISASLMLDAGHLNRTLAKLTDNGFITQKKNPEDRRASIVELTEKGRNVFTDSQSLFQDWDRLVLSPLQDDEHIQIMELIKKICVSKSDIYKNFNRTMEEPK